MLEKNTLSMVAYLQGHLMSGVLSLSQRRVQPREMKNQGTDILNSVQPEDTENQGTITLNSVQPRQMKKQEGFKVACRSLEDVKPQL